MWITDDGLRSGEADPFAPEMAGTPSKPPYRVAGSVKVWLAALVCAAALAALVSGCAGSTAVSSVDARGDPAVPAPAPAPAAHRTPQSLVRVPPPDYANPASVAASFFTAWASVDAIRDGPDASLTRCAGLVTPAFERQLLNGQPAPANWQAMRANRTVSLVRVQAITHPAAAPLPSRARIYLRIYAEHVTTTAAGRTVTRDGTTVELIRQGSRWLVTRLLFY